MRFPAYVFLLLIGFFAVPAEAASSSDTLKRVETYLNAITTIEADFMQIAADGSLAEGKFYLERPGKMRWQYKPPVPVLMISNGTALSYYDFELDQLTSIPLDDTLAGFLAQETIRFDPEVIKILSIEAKDAVIRLRIAQTKKPGEGELTLEFSDAPVQLRNMTIKDASGQQTNVSLNNAQFGKKLDKNLFIFRDPRIYRDEKRR